LFKVWLHTDGAHTKRKAGHSWYWWFWHELDENL